MYRFPFSQQHEPAVEEPLVNHSKDELQVPGGPQKNTPSLTDPSKGGDNNASASGKDSSSVSSKEQLGESPCSSCEESCSKCPDCPACCCFDSKNPEAIVASNAGTKCFNFLLLLQNNSALKKRKEKQSQQKSTSFLHQIVSSVPILASLKMKKFLKKNSKVVNASSALASDMDREISRTIRLKQDL